MAKVPVKRKNLPPLPYARVSKIRAQDLQQVTNTAAPTGASQKQNEVTEPTINQNGKRLRERESLNVTVDEFGTLVPTRMQEACGVLVRRGFATGQQTRSMCPRLLSPDYMDAIHLNDHGYFLGSIYGFGYYIWRYVMRQKSGISRFDENLFSPHLPSFSLSFLSNSPMSQEQIGSTYTYLYACWWRATFKNSENLNAFFSNMARWKGLKKIEPVLRAWHRVLNFFNDALQEWKEKPGTIDALAFLRATEEFWFNDDIAVEKKGFLPKLWDPLKGESVFWTLESEAGNRFTDGHRERVDEQFPGYKSKTFTPLTEPAVQKIEGWKYDQAGQDRCEACTVAGHPMICPDHQHKEFPPLLVEPDLTLVEVAEWDEYMQWKPKLVDEFFDFDKAIETGLAEKRQPGLPKSHLDSSSSADNNGSSSDHQVSPAVETDVSVSDGERVSGHRRVGTNLAMILAETP